MCVRAAYYIYKGCTDAQHTYTFFWSAEEILLLRREKIFPLRSRKNFSALKFSPRKDVCRSVGAPYICGCSDRPTSTWRPKIQPKQKIFRVNEQKSAVYLFYALEISIFAVQI